MCLTPLYAQADFAPTAVQQTVYLAIKTATEAQNTSIQMRSELVSHSQRHAARQAGFHYVQGCEC